MFLILVLLEGLSRCHFKLTFSRSGVKNQTYLKSPQLKCTINGSIGSSELYFLFFPFFFSLFILIFPLKFPSNMADFSATWSPTFSVGRNSYHNRLITPTSKGRFFQLQSVQHFFCLFVFRKEKVQRKRRLRKNSKRKQQQLQQQQ